MTISNYASPCSKKKKFLSIKIILIVNNGSHKYNSLFQAILYKMGITTEDDNGIISSEYEYIKPPEYFPESNNPPLFSRYITSWFQTFDLNEVSLIHFLYECLFPLKVSISGENSFIILHKFSSLFKFHNLENLSKENKKIRFFFINYLDNEIKLDILQSLTKKDLRTRANFVFATSTSLISKNIKTILVLATNVPCLSSNFPTCGVAILVEVKANSFLTSFATTKN